MCLAVYARQAYVRAVVQPGRMLRSEGGRTTRVDLLVPTRVHRYSALYSPPNIARTYTKTDLPTPVRRENEPRPSIPPRSTVSAARLEDAHAALPLCAHRSELVICYSPT